MSLVFGSANVKLVDHHQFVVAHLGRQRHPRGQLQRLARQAIAVVAADLGKDVTAATANTAAPRAGAGVARALLAIHLLGRAGDLRRASWSVRTLPHVRLVHHHRVVQQLLVDARREVGGVDVVRPDFLPLRSR